MPEEPIVGFYSERIFPRILEWASNDPELGKLRERAVSGAGGRVLEIGFGTGRNLEHYPRSVRRITAVDPNPGMAELAQERMRAGGIEVEHHQITAEQLPFDSRSFDCVVSTLTLCSIPDAASALKEVHRVLRAGGRFLFLEHGRHPSPATQRWQDRLDPIWKVVFDGCHINRDIPEMIRRAGLEIGALENPVLPKAPQWVGYGYLGTAQRMD